MGEGLQRIVKSFGRMVIQGEMWVWDYANNVAVKEKNMRVGSARWAASEQVRADLKRKAVQPESQLSGGA